MKLINIFLLLLLSIVHINVYAQVNDTEIQPPLELKTIQENIPSKINISEFQKSMMITLPDSVLIDKKLRIKTETLVNPKQSMSGDFFKAQIVEDLFLPTEYPFLIIPQGSWVTGRLSYVKKPTLFSMSAKVTVGLDQLTTPLGDIIPLLANLELQEEYKESSMPPSNPLEILVPSSFLDKEITSGLIHGSLIGLCLPSQGLIIYTGQELQIVLHKPIQFINK